MPTTRRQPIDAALILVVGAVLSAVVCWPMVSGGPVLLLDWVIGGAQSVVPPAAHGLDGGLLAGAPFPAAANALSALVGDAATWLPIALFFPLGALSITTYVGGELPGRVGAALFFTCNPFVFDRIAVGQIGVLWGMALVPLGLQRASSQHRPIVRALEVSALWTAMVACSVHYLWIFGVALLVTIASEGRRPGLWRFATTTVVLTGLLNLYLVVGQAGQDAGVKVGGGDLLAYRSQSDSRFGLLGNLLGLYGFWRRGPRLDKSSDPAWWLVFLALAVVMVIGGVSAWRDEQRRGRVRAVLILGLAGLFLAAGDQGPTGPVYRACYNHVGPFKIMREPQKFLVLLALAYAALFAWGIGALISRATSDLRVIGASLLVVLPLFYSPTLASGLGGQVRARGVPTSWATAASEVRHDPGNVLVLPWHQYLGFAFARSVIANPGARTFGTVISGDNVELPSLPTTSTSVRSAYIEALLARKGITQDFGHRVAVLGVDDVVLYKTADDTAYAWLRTQADLVLRFDSPDISVFHNTAYGPTTTSTAATTGMSTPADAAAAPTGTTPLLGTALPSTGAPATITRTSATSTTVDIRGSGLVATSLPWSSRWRASSGTVAETAYGTVAVLASGHVVLSLQHAELTLRIVQGDLIAWLLLVAAVGGLAVLRRRGTTPEVPVPSRALDRPASA